ncbi:hypothetical protein DPMN_050498 [Dreissena polymorpha]|uniref:Uncharacterized protein n=1 Tax=Dreissena polymorpha TaxID=45954 RepID=A0A9D4HN45_DREPO|nr:hypothetical protein DPMN_050498 [Dreissena polymorpha]
MPILLPTTSTTHQITSTDASYLATTTITRSTISATSVSGCIDLNVSQHWDIIGPNIQHIKVLPSPDHALVYCQPGFRAFLANKHAYADHFQITCSDGAWKSHSVCQNIDAVHLIG